jgi:LmbE family N-acetylglucosaminyl deacetylase
MNILAIGPHPDDVELGCFATLAKLKAQGHSIHILLLSNGEGGGDPKKRLQEAKKSAALLDAKIYFGNLPDTRISDGIETITVIEKHIKKINPDMIFVNSEKDTHQDHRNAARALISATRFGPDEIYMYESPSTSKSFIPVIYYDVTEHFDKKMQAVKIHLSQGNKSYMADRAIKGLAEYRAYEIGLNDRLVEGFEVVKVVMR